MQVLFLLVGFVVVQMAEASNLSSNINDSFSDK